MEIQDLIELFRKQVDDTEAPYLWDDKEVLQYVIDAQDLFVRAIGGISDYSTAALTEVAVTANTAMSSFSRYILRIRSIKLLTSKRALDIISESDVGKYTKKTDYGLTSKVYLDDTDTGSVYAAVLGIEDHKIRWYKVPTVSETAKLHIFRLPYPRITKQEDDLEIEEQHHIHLIPYMKYMAYSKEDAETYDRDLAETNRLTFEKYCEKAREEKERQRYKPRIMHSNY